MALDPRETRFVDHYISEKKPNATKSAIAAGCPKRSAHELGRRLLKKVEVAAEIKRRMDKSAEASDITAERLDATLIALAEFDIRAAFNADGTPKPISEIPDDVAKAISAVEVDEEGNITKFKFVERVRPVELLLKRGNHLVDRHEHTGKDGKPLVAPVTLDMSNVSDKTLDRLADILADAPSQ